MTLREWLCKYLGVLCPPDPPPPPPPPPPEEQIVKPGVRWERRMKVPCALQFDFKPAAGMPPDSDKAYILWDYDTEWQGGNPVPINYCGGVRTYKTKQYDIMSYVGEKRFNIVWNPGKTYTMRVVVDPGVVTYQIRDEVGAMTEHKWPAQAPAEVTLGMGWPPSQRPGIVGAKITNVKWIGNEVVA